MTRATAVLAGCLLAVSSAALAQETGIHVRAIRVLATDPDAVATFYKKAFGMSETRRPANSATFKEIVINSGASVEMAKKSATTPIVIATRPKGAPASTPGSLAALVLEVPDLDNAIQSATANGGTLVQPAATSGEGLHYAFLKDPEGNQIELVMTPK